MSGSVNKVTLIGRLGQDPEVVSTSGDTQIVKFSVATSDRWKDRTSGEQRERVEWHRIVIFNEHLGRIAEQYLRKGSQVYLEGQLQTQKWQDKNGQDRWTTEVVLARYRGELTMLGGRNDTGAGPQSDSPSIPSEKNVPSEASPPPMRSNDADDDIPF